MYAIRSYYGPAIKCPDPEALDVRIVNKCFLEGILLIRHNPQGIAGKSFILASGLELNNPVLFTD